MAAFLFAFVAQRLERTLETGETEVQLLPKAPALVAQWIEQAASIGEVAGPTPAEGTKHLQIIVMGIYS